MLISYALADQVSTIALWPVSRVGSKTEFFAPPHDPRVAHTLAVTRWPLSHRNSGIFASRVATSIMNSMLRLFAYFWAFPATLLGLFFWPSSVTHGGARIVDGVLELHGPLVRFFLTRCTLLEGGASAMTLGHVVIGRDAQLLELTRSHERVHVRQYERWGPFFIPAYLGISAVLWYRGRPAYMDNPFEREAYANG